MDYGRSVRVRVRTRARVSVKIRVRFRFICVSQNFVAVKTPLMSLQNITRTHQEMRYRT